PCRMPWVGSWFSQNTFSSCSYAIADGSYTTWTTSACPVSPEHTSSYVALGVRPPAYPTEVEYTPGSCQNSRSAPQKQPIPTTARSSPSGKGGLGGVPSTAWRSATGISALRPGSAPGALTIFVFWPKPSTCQA